MYIFGGRSDQGGPYHTNHEVYCNKVQIFNTTTHDWFEPATTGQTPIGRRSHSACECSVGRVILVAIIEPTILVPCLYIKSLQIIGRSGIPVFNLWMPAVKVRWNNFSKIRRYQDRSLSIGFQMVCCILLLLTHQSLVMSGDDACF